MGKVVYQQNLLDYIDDRLASMELENHPNVSKINDHFNSLVTQAHELNDLIKQHE